MKNIKNKLNETKTLAVPKIIAVSKTFKMDHIMPLIKWAS